MAILNKVSGDHGPLEEAACFLIGTVVNCRELYSKVGEGLIHRQRDVYFSFIYKPELRSDFLSNLKMHPVLLSFADVDDSNYDHERWDLTAQQSMEILVDRLNMDRPGYTEFVRRIQDGHGNFLDVCDWFCVQCDEEGEVIEVDLSEKPLNAEYDDDPNEVSGNLNTHFLPRSLLELRIESSKLYGSFDFSSLPPKLESLQLNHTDMKGTLDFTALPSPLRKLDIFCNKFQGTINLTALPNALAHMQIIDCLFTGTIDLRSLSAGIKLLMLSTNKLRGTINLQSLPAGMEELILYNNNFTGGIALDMLPAGFKTLNVGFNQLTGTLDVSKLPASMKELVVCANDFSGVLDLKTAPEGVNVVYTPKKRTLGEDPPTSVVNARLRVIQRK